MAAVTVNRARYAVMGNKRTVLATITTANTGDTYNTKFKVLDALSLDPLEASTPGTSATISGGTVTINYSGGGGATFTVIGHGT
jgi:hypothetical protein